MALYKQGILGAFRNKVGTVVGRIWRSGKFVMAGLPQTHSKTATNAQLLIQARFKAIGNLAGAFLSATNLGLKNMFLKRGSTQAGEFVRLNWNNVQATTPDSVTIDYAEIEVSRGSLTGVQFGTADFDTPNQVEVAFTTNEEVDGTSLLDKVYLFVYCPDTQAGILSAPVARSVQSTSLMVPSFWGGMKVHVWGFVVGADNNTKGKVSNSVYIGSGNIS